MGLGGYLTWTAAAREIVSSAGIPNLKVFPFEQHGSLIRPIKSPIFKNNPNFCQNISEGGDMYFPLQLNHPQTNYCKDDTPQKAVHRYDKHIIHQICEFYGIRNARLKCDIFLDSDEENHIQSIIVKNKVPSRFLVIDPSCNKEYTKNKFDEFAKWQSVVNDLKGDITFVQVGLAGSRLLEGAIDITGQTSFRHAAGIIKRSLGFVGSEGGLVHAATSFNKRSVVIITGFIHPDLVAYPLNKNIWINGDNHGPCGMKAECKKCTKASAEFDHNIISDNINELLGELN